MLDLDNLEFMNLASYVGQMKVAIEILYSQNNIVPSKDAQEDLKRIALKDFIKSFSLSELEEWEQGNRLLGIRSYLDYIIVIFFNHQEAYEKRFESPSGNYTPLIIENLTATQQKLVRRCVAHWDALTNLFYNRIQDIDTINLLLKNAEALRAKNLGYVTTGDSNDLAIFLDERIAALCNLLRQKITDIQNIPPQLSSMPTAEKLPNKLTDGEWKAIFNILVINKYLPKDYTENHDLIISWLHFSFLDQPSTDKILFGRKLRWIGTPTSLAEFIIKAIDAKWFIYKEADKYFLYAWVDRVFDYDGISKSMQTYLRAAKASQTHCFYIAKSSDGKIDFKVNFTATKPKRKKI